MVTWPVRKAKRGRSTRTYGGADGKEEGKRTERTTRLPGTRFRSAARGVPA